MSRRSSMKIFVSALLLLCGFAVLAGWNYSDANIAHAEQDEASSVADVSVVDEDQAAVPMMGDGSEGAGDVQSDRSYEVQAVLSAKRRAVISGTMDGVLEELPFENGDVFKKGDVLAQYICDYEVAKVREVEARFRASERRIDAYKRLKTQDVVADIEYVSVKEEHEQLKALIEQAKSREKACSIKAPFDGRVTDRLVSNYEVVKSGRVMMEISSMEPLQAELLVPSLWLRWLNVGAPLYLDVHETGKRYPADIVRIHGQVDPVTQTVRVVAEIADYEEELLPGMTGSAVFKNPKKYDLEGFLGMKIEYE